MTYVTAIKSKWLDTPTIIEDAERALQRHPECVACGSTLLLPLLRPPIDAYRVHCNHCGSEIPMAVMLNREAWRITAQMAEDVPH